MRGFGRRRTDSQCAPLATRPLRGRAALWRATARAASVRRSVVERGRGDRAPWHCPARGTLLPHIWRCTKTLPPEWRGGPGARAHRRDEARLAGGVAKAPSVLRRRTGAAGAHVRRVCAVGVVEVRLMEPGFVDSVAVGSASTFLDGSSGVEPLHGAFLCGLAREYGRGERARSWRRELAPVGAGEGRPHLRTPRGVQLFLPLEARDLGGKGGGPSFAGGGPGVDVGAVSSVQCVTRE